MRSAFFRSVFYTRMKRFLDENISIYDSEVKLFLKQGISCQHLGRGWMYLFDLNAIIQQLTLSLIFYEKYCTSQSDLWFRNFHWPDKKNHWPRAIGPPLRHIKYAELSELTGKYDVFGKNLLSTSVRKQFSLCQSVKQCL